MPLVILGIIVLIAATYLISGGLNFSRKNINARWSDPHHGAQIKPRKQYKKSEDGKVVYLYDDEPGDNDKKGD